MEYSVWLYGSRARGDHDEMSDHDVLFVGPKVALTQYTNETVPAAERPTTQYEWQEVMQMASYGSLFLWHLRKEGIELGGTSWGRRRLWTLLDSLGPYRHARRDLRSFETCLADVRGSLETGGTVPFELSVLSGMIRHASVLACYLTGEPVFGRITCCEEAAKRLGADSRLPGVFERAYRFHLWEHGRVERPPVEWEADVELAVALAGDLLSKLEVWC